MSANYGVNLDKLEGVANNKVAPINYSITSTTSTAQDRIFLLPFWLDRACKIDRIRFEQTGTSTTNQVTVGIVTMNSEGRPDTVVVQSGAITTSLGAGTYAYDMSLSPIILQPNYYYGVLWLSTTQSMRGGSYAGKRDFQIADSQDALAPNFYISEVYGTGVLPTNLSSLTLVNISGTVTPIIDFEVIE